MCRKKSHIPCSSLEVLLSTVTILLFMVCVGLAVVAWLALEQGNEGQTGSNNSSFSGSLIISEGASFSDELRNTSSVNFKALAFDTELLISEAYTLGSLNTEFRSCRVTEFSPGSVIVHFTLMFSDVVDVSVVQQQLITGLQNIPESTLIINSSSVHVTVISTTQVPPTTTHQPVKCPEGQKLCRDEVTCVYLNRYCDGEPNCPDASDESHSTCATVCDGQFLLLGPSGFFQSNKFPPDYKREKICRWIIRVNKGEIIRVDLAAFDTALDVEVLNVYEGIGDTKVLTYSLSGPSPGVVRVFSHEATLQFRSDFSSSGRGFNASYRAESLAHVSNEAKLTCSFEDGFCFWRHDDYDDGDWMRGNGPPPPSVTGPSSDHTFANQSDASDDFQSNCGNCPSVISLSVYLSVFDYCDREPNCPNASDMSHSTCGYYIITQNLPGSWERKFLLRSLPLVPAGAAMCLRFWYHMFGDTAQRLIVSGERDSTLTVLFQKEGNYGNVWNYGQITLNVAASQTIAFEARKKGGTRNNVALDDISLTSGPCGVAPPDPTTVPPPTTPPPGPADCGGPFDLYEPNTTFSSPNYPHNYRDDASCVWILHARPGQNIQLHFQDFSLEAAYDMLEIRDGVEPDSTLLSVLTGKRDFPDLFSSGPEMTVIFYSDSSGSDRGFLANFSAGFNLGQETACLDTEYRCRSGVCVSADSVCDGVSNCPDASDEAQCVSLSPAPVPRLKVEVRGRLHSVCSSDWSARFSTYFCTYMGYRSGSASFVSVVHDDAPFVTVTQAAGGAVSVKPSEKCPSDEVVSLRCDNQPCGKRKVAINSEVTLEDEGEDVDGRIVGGEDAVKGAWPWIASLRWLGKNVCGGALIDSQWIVTAAHCVFGKNIHLSNWNVILGLHAQYETNTTDRQSHQITQIIINQHYNRRTKDSDIALLHLHNRVNYTDYIQPICLPYHDQEFAGGRKCVTAGWGRLTEGGEVADVLQQAVLPLVNNSVCQERLPEYNITDHMMCAGYTEGGIDTCQGDSGGPLMCEEGSGSGSGPGSWVLAGVTSFGLGCARPGRPGVYARVTRFMDWIVESRRAFSHWDGAR